MQQEGRHPKAAGCWAPTPCLGSAGAPGQQWQWLQLQRDPDPCRQQQGTSPMVRKGSGCRGAAAVLVVALLILHVPAEGLLGLPGTVTVSS